MNSNVVVENGAKLTWYRPATRPAYGRAASFIVPDADYSETEFINLILRRTGCGLLLDITNVYTNAVNFGYDPKEWIDRVDLKRVQLVHLAGGYFDPDGFLMDSHDNSVPEEAWYVRACRWGHDLPR